MTTGSQRFQSIISGVTQHKKIFIIVLLLILLYASTGKRVNTNNFDYFVFSQRWLPSACIEYIEKNASSHHCTLPNNYKFWAIHGLWPTRTHQMGPFFCNNSMAFDLKKLQPIESTLKLTWPNIEEGKSTDSLWQHEWSKHGTCAAQLESLNSELKYFNATLNFFNSYNMQNFLVKNNLLKPDSFIAVSDIINAIKSQYSKLPQIHCIHEVKTNQPYLSEIRLCYNKNLELMDCGNIHNFKFKSILGKSSGLTNCPLDRKVKVPGAIDELIRNKYLFRNFVKKKDYYSTLMDVLNLIKFLQWVSI